MITSERRGVKWSIRKDVSVGDIVAFIMAFAAVCVAYFSLDKRISVLEATTVEATKAAELWRLEVRDDLKEINHKVDKLLDTRK